MKRNPEPGERSVPLKGLLVRELRQRCGWTQEVLAEQTGLADRSIRSAESGKPLHLQSIKKLCDVFNRALMLSLTPIQLIESPPKCLESVQDVSGPLQKLIEGTYGTAQDCQLTEFVSAEVVYFCELGTLLGIAELEHRVSASRYSSDDPKVTILSQSASGEYAAASWIRSTRGSSVKTAETFKLVGFTCVRVQNGCIVEAWDFPACSSALTAVPNELKPLKASVNVKGELVRAKRIAQALTQQDLATRAALSVRLIRSAENGGNISRRSLQILANALDLPSESLETQHSTTESTSRSAQRAREFLEQIWNFNNYEVIQTHLTERFRFHHEAGVVSDRQEMRTRIEQFRRSFSEFDFRVTSTLDFGTFVVCKWQVEMTHSGNWMDLKPSGKRITVFGSSWVHVVGELFGDAWDFWDIRLAYTQLAPA